MKVYYKNLNSLRFIAASLVIIHHTEQYKWFRGLPHYFFDPVIFLFGKLGVDIFFVLSGFLITSLLVIEKDRYKKIDIRKFYIRRILRIWPLYFLIALLALFVWPHVPALRVPQMADPYKHLVPNVLLIFLFLPNLQMLLYKAITYEAQAWSIGVEEQFYLVWPFIMNFTKNRRHFKKAVIVLLGLYLLIKLSFFLIPLLTHHFNKLNDLNFYLADIFQIDCMMIGGLFALFNFEERSKKIITNKFVQVAAYILVVVFTARGLTFGFFYWEIYALLFGVIILNLVNTQTSLISLDFKWMDYLGKISYSMYMFHVLMINVVLQFFTHNPFVIYPLVFIFTIIISILSYEFFEKRFLHLKSAYAKVQSGSDPKVGM